LNITLSNFWTAGLDDRSPAARQKETWSGAGRVGGCIYN
jgi:hypothetical protein